MNCKSGLADILRRINCHFQDIEKESFHLNDGVQRSGGLGSSSGGGSPLNSQTSEGISLMNQSLKFSERSPLLDAALSLMGYRIPHVFNSTTNILVNTLITFLLSTISCRFLSKSSHTAIKIIEIDANSSHDPCDIPWQKKDQKATLTRTSDWWPSCDQEFLQIGSFLSVSEFSKLLEACESIFRNLEGHGNLSMLLMDALLRVATSITLFKVQFPLSLRTYKKFTKGKLSPRNLLNLLVKKEDIVDQKFNSSLRLRAWRLQPLLLKQDLANFLLEAMQRPLLHLKDVLHHRDPWHSLVINLAAAPDIFMEARCLLHEWFLLIGANRILEVCIELVAAVLDVLSNPSGWGMSVDEGLKLPTSSAFFCHRQQPLLKTLMRPLSCGNLSTVVDTLEHIQSLQAFDPCIYYRVDTLQNIHGLVTASFLSDQKSSEMALLINHNSAWALLLDFPLWFHFASMLLFQAENCSEAEPGIVCCNPQRLHSNNGVQNVDEVISSEYDSSHNAAKLLGWILSPIDDKHRDLVVRSLLEASKCWNHKRSKLPLGLQRKEIEECLGSEHSSLVLENENKLKRKRSLFSLETEHDIRVKKAKVEASENDVPKMDTLSGLDESTQAVILWLADFSSLCSKLCIGPAISDLVDNNQCTDREPGNHEGWDESEGKDDGSHHNTPSDAWLKQYTFLRRIALGLFLSNVHILNEQACHVLLHFAAADNNLALIPDVAADIYSESKKHSWATRRSGHVATSSNGENVRMDIDTEEPAHRTESFAELMLLYFQNEGSTNWIEVTAIILNFFDTIGLSYSVFQNGTGCPSLFSEVRGKAGKFLVTCIKKLLECQDLRDPNLLIDLRSRFVNWTQQGEALFNEGTLYQDVLRTLDSQISLLHANL